VLDLSQLTPETRQKVVNAAQDALITILTSPFRIPGEKDVYDYAVQILEAAQRG
jgi:hypothetical protein